MSSYRIGLFGLLVGLKKVSMFLITENEAGGLGHPLEFRHRLSRPSRLIACHTPGWVY
jgi:hypothetical protein